MDFQFQHAKVSHVEVTRLDTEHGDMHKAYEAMGAPRFPSKEQIEKLRSAARLSPAEMHEAKNGSVTIAIPSQGLVLLEAKPEH